MKRWPGGGAAMDPDVIAKLMVSNARNEPIGRLTRA